MAPSFLQTRWAIVNCCGKVLFTSGAFGGISWGVGSLRSGWAFKLRELDPGRCLETGGIAPDGVRKEVAGGAPGRRKKRPLGKRARTE